MQTDTLLFVSSPHPPIQILSLPVAKGNKVSCVWQTEGAVLTTGDAVGQSDVDPAEQLLIDQPQR